MAKPASLRDVRVLHVASHIINVGDGALNGVIQNRLQRLADREIEFTPYDVVVDRRNLSVEDLDAFDLVVVGGGGAISASSMNADNGTALPATLDVLRASRVPTAFVAIGHNLFAGEAYPFAEQLAALLTWCAESGHPFSVRNDGSRDRLSALLASGVIDDVVEIPDPGFFVVAEPHIPDACGSSRFALIQFAADRPDSRFGQDPRSRARRRMSGSTTNPRVDAALDDIADYARWLVDAHGMEVVFAPHVPNDVVFVGRLMERLPAGVTSNYAARPFRTLGLPHPRNASLFFGAYATADLVMGMRGHAVICGVGLGRPVVALSTHPKIAGFMKACGLEAWTVGPGPGLLGSLTTCSAAVLGSDRREYERSRDDATRGFSDSFDEFLVRVLDHAGISV